METMGFQSLEILFEDCLEATWRSRPEPQDASSLQHHGLWRSHHSGVYLLVGAWIFWPCSRRRQLHAVIIALTRNCELAHKGRLALNALITFISKDLKFKGRL